MESVQEGLNGLRQQGWTLAAIADEFNIGRRSLERWRAGMDPPWSGMVLLAIEALRKRQPPPKRRVRR